MRASAAAAVAAAVLGGTLARGAFGPRYGGEARVVVRGLPSTFAPGSGRGAATRLVGTLVHERLVEVAGGVAHPSLAAALEEGASGREWTIRLRAGALFHDGAPVTGADVVRSLRRFLRSRSAAAARLGDLLDGGAAYRAAGSGALPGVLADGDTVVLRLRAASALAPAALAAPEAAITGGRGAGAGPFVPTTPGPINGQARFVAFSRHVRGRPFLDAVAVDEAGAAPRPALSPSAEAGPLAATLLLVLEGRGKPAARPEDRRRLAAAMDGTDLVRLFIPRGGPSSLVPPVLLPPVAAPPPAPARGIAGALPLAVSTDVPPAVSQRVVALLTAAGLQVSVGARAPDEVWEAPAAARLVLFTPAVADPLLALDELAALAPGADTPAARALRDRAAVEADPGRRAVLVARAEAELRATAVLVPLAAVPVGFRGLRGMHGAAIDAGGRIRLEDAWLEP
jgi:hypothetical protein